MQICPQTGGNSKVVICGYCHQPLLTTQMMVGLRHLAAAQRVVGVNLKITANCAENKTLSRRAIAREHCVMKSCRQDSNESSPFISNAVRNAQTTPLQKRKVGPFCGDSS